MAMEMGPEMALLKVNDSWTKVESHAKCFGPVPFGSSSPKSYTKLKSMVTDILEDQQKEALTSTWERSRKRDGTATRPFQAMLREEWRLQAVDVQRLVLSVQA